MCLARPLLSTSDPARTICFVVVRNPSALGRRRELVANCVHTADDDATQLLRRVGDGGDYTVSQKTRKLSKADKPPR